MDFGLGLVLSFTDNATAGMQNAVNTLNQLTSTAQDAAGQLNDLAGLTAFSTIATRVGDSMTGMGSAIVSSFSQIIGKVNDTGLSLMYAENQLGKLYEGTKSGRDVVKEISEYAKRSIFEFEDLIPIVTLLKANGIEAFDEIYSSSGKVHQKLMDYASDLAAFNPQMRNVYGTGINAAMGALNEYIAEGNAMSLKRGASLDITSILGEEKGKTIEERSRQVADLLEKLNMVGMTKDLEESPMTKLSNMQDTLFQFIGKVADSGVLDSYNRIITIFSGFVNSISDSRLDKFAQIIGDALSSLMSPLEKLAEWFVKASEGIMSFLENNPELARFAIIATAVAGALLIVGGVALKIAGSLGYLTLMLKSLNASFTSIGAAIKFGAKKVVTNLAPVVLSAGLLLYAWKRDLFGVRTVVSGFVQNVANSFNTARDAVSGDVNHMKEVLSGIDKTTFFGGLTLAITRVMVLFKALSEGWNGFTLSEDTFLKAKELGILPLIEAIFDLKYRFDMFKEGFIQGWTNISNIVVSVWNAISSAIDGTIFESAFNAITGFFQLLSNNDAESWRTVGEIFAYISAQVIAGYVAFKTFSKVVSIITGVISVIRTFGTAIAGVFKFIVSNPIVLAIAGVITMVGSFISMWTEGVNKVNAGIYAIGAVITAVGLGLLTSNPFVALVALIVSGVIALVAVIKDNWTEIKNFLYVLWLGISLAAKSIWEDIKNFFSELWQGLKAIVMVFSLVIKTLIFTTIDSIRTKVVTVVTSIKTTFVNIGNSIVSAVRNTFTTVKNTISSAITNAKNVVSSGLEAIKGFFSNLTLKLPHIDLPHFSISGGFSLKPPSIPHISVDWYKHGGVFDKPSIIGVGEQGREAVMPLENNTQWIGMLAGEISSTLKSSLIPSNTRRVDNMGYEGSSNRSSTVYEGNSDNRVIFNSGAIQLIVRNASEEEAIRLAKIIMQYIKRQEELKRMTSYA